MTEWRIGIDLGGKTGASASALQGSRMKRFRRLVEDLNRKGRQRSPTGANPGDKRRFYALQLYLTGTERKRLEAAARAERRSVSGYVATGDRGRTRLTHG